MSRKQALRMTLRIAALLVVAIGIFYGFNAVLTAVFDEPWDSIVGIAVLVLVFCGFNYRLMRRDAARDA